MKLNFFENDYGLDLHLEPESVEEFAKMARFATNAKSKRPTIYLSIGNSPTLYISMQKVVKHMQKNSISPFKKQ